MIAIERLSKRYGETAAVADVSLEIAEGESLAIVGSSGSGKSTLLKTINRLVEPSAGRVVVDGEDVSTVAPHLLRRRIGYVMQGAGLFPHRTAFENISTTPRLLRWEEPRIRARVDELLTLLGLDPATYGPRKPHELSGGEQQRVGVARALAAEPRVLLMDEPFGALDPAVRAKAQVDLAALRKRLGLTIVLVTHDMDEAARLGDRIAVMHRGRLLQQGTPAEIFSRPATPEVAALVASDDRPFRLLALGSVRDLVEPGSAAGDPVAVEATLRGALGALLWSRRDAAPVVGAGGEALGIVTLKRLIEAGAEPKA
ncbi:ABC transporter ATP-binding protein [Hansschlegelia quercus]|uniref:ABC transporter ATP-binding protein n=1 Tax=Hansschlegelia quercus TaxID=2528245 RepID=A0A4Q9GPL3_9HYPH|nr:ABC transporter ATP-binding protein [Hansschlegelia quercus]TBN54734.1 ABC transporter ATP-binding protein [Hansschlegelia quercus]